MTFRTTPVHRLLAATACALLLSGCNLVQRMSDVGGGPQLTQITDPTARPSYRPVSMPMPMTRSPEDNPNSLWRAGARAFFKDQRAKEVGDILTVKLDLEDSATLENSTNRERDDAEDADLTSFLGFEAELAKKLPQAVDPTNLLSFGNKSSTKGEGDIARKETIELTFAAVVTQILPNGNLVLMGRQEVRVNAELRELLVTGVIRPEDIDSMNTVNHTKIAEMRIAYGGRGTISDLQQPRWGTQIWDIIFPF